LYDLESDPGEEVDISRREPERSARMLAALDRFAAEARAHSELRELTGEERDALRRLGYLSSSPSSAGWHAGAAPR
jgi:hypothetical protein